MALSSFAPTRSLHGVHRSRARPVVLGHVEARAEFRTALASPVCLWCFPTTGRQLAPLGGVCREGGRLRLLPRLPHRRHPGARAVSPPLSAPPAPAAEARRCDIGEAHTNLSPTPLTPPFTLATLPRSSDSTPGLLGHRLPGDPQRPRGGPQAGGEALRAPLRHLRPEAAAHVPKGQAEVRGRPAGAQMPWCCAFLASYSN